MCSSKMREEYEKFQRANWSWIWIGNKNEDLGQFAHAIKFTFSRF